MAQTVSEVMTTKPKTIRAEDPLTKAAKAMRAADAGAVVVRDSDTVCGVLTDRDIVVRAIAEGRDPSQVRAADICSQDVVSVNPEDEIDYAVTLMRQHHVRRLPVVQDGHAVGIVSLGDLALERDPGSVLGQISAAPGNR